ncbi:hypothetical protein O3P69_015555 [Scylla paramamosain]|uniref:Uncharacterized protein n=1 Tax=Scylla paramamosain TaxID=85552 RepID=A0AAW0SFG5_SCYPA
MRATKQPHHQHHKHPKTPIRTPIHPITPVPHLPNDLASRVLGERERAGGRGDVTASLIIPGAPSNTALGESTRSLALGEMGRLVGDEMGRLGKEGVMGRRVVRLGG